MIPRTTIPLSSGLWPHAQEQSKVLGFFLAYSKIRRMHSDPELLKRDWKNVVNHCTIALQTFAGVPSAQKQVIGLYDNQGNASLVALCRPSFGVSADFQVARST